MTRRERILLFRSRLGQAMERNRLNQAELARAAGIDRSTLAQLLNEQGLRMPSGHTIADLANVLKVSADWLLGLTSQAQPVAEVLEGSLEFRKETRSPVDENLSRWFEEATGYKIRTVPTTLPHVVKIEEVLEFEYGLGLDRTPQQAIADTAEKLIYIRLPETDMEICLSMQAVRAFVEGRDIWVGLDESIRRAQLNHMIEVVDELYPTLRLYLYDARKTFSVPFTLFGPLRAAIYIGQSYFVFNTTKHIRLLTQHFDNLVRSAEVQAHELSAFLKRELGRV